MHRQLLLDLLDRYNPEASEEQAYKRDMISFINRYDQCFERSLEVGHITCSAWLLSKDRSKALLMHHAKLDKWFQLGGHSDGNPDTLAVAIKETQEESGIESIVPVSKDIFDIDIHLTTANKREREHFHYDVRFLLGVDSDEKVIQNIESKELRWIGKDRKELPSTEPSIVRMFDKWIGLQAE